MSYHIDMLRRVARSGRTAPSARRKPDRVFKYRVQTMPHVSLHSRVVEDERNSVLVNGR